MASYLWSWQRAHSRVIPKNALSQGVGTVHHVIGAVFLLYHPALLRDRVVAVEPGRQELFPGGIGQQVAGQLPGQEFIVGQVFVEGVDDPVAPGPHGTVAVVLIAVGIGIARHVEP